VTPRTADPFKPPPTVSFTNGQVNRAGGLIRDFWYRNPAPDDDPFTGWDVNELAEAMVRVTWWRGLHARPLSTVAAALRYHVDRENARIDARIDVAQRLKRRNTIIDKLEREPSMKLTQMQDIGGVRARLPNLRYLQAVSQRLKKNWTIVRTKDYVDDPKDSGYRALHHIVRRHGRLIEVQLRTVRQDAWANQVEDDGRKLGVGYKFGAGEEEVHDYYRSVAEVFAFMDREQAIPPEILEELQRRYEPVRDRLGREAARGRAR
jgi:ppGpp synthetase/RelA/SpoT-type nucleotidyltranferase